MTRPVRQAVALLACLAAVPSAGAAQQADPSGDDLRVFLDCQTFGCDQDFLRVELDWIDWVRDRQVADVHALVTAQPTGGGGRLFSLRLLGRGAFEGEEAELTFASSGDATDDDVRRGLAQRLAAGLVRFALRTPVADRLRISVDDAGGGEPDAEGADDPWDLWVFTLGVNGFLNGESSQSFSNVFGSAEASRTDDLWKLSLRGSFSRNESSFELEDSTVTSLRETWGTDAFAVRSLGGRWALGVRGEMGSSTRFNQDFYAFVAPGVEFNFFPYEESTRRALTLQWLVGGRYLDWEEETIYGELEETRLNQALTLALDLNQPWGQADVGLTGSHYLHDAARWRVELGGSVEVRLFRGFSFNVGGSYQWIRDQLHVPATELTNEEILLQQQQLATDFSYFTHFGIRYRFGSIFNNVVNPRFGGGYRPY